MAGFGRSCGPSKAKEVVRVFVLGRLVVTAALGGAMVAGEVMRDEILCDRRRKCYDPVRTKAAHA